MILKRFAGAAALFVLTGSLPAYAGAVQTPIYTVLSDAGSPGDDIYIWGPLSGNSVLLSSSATNPVPPEGIHSMQVTWPVPTGTWAIVYLTPAPIANRSVDLSAYASSGEIRFWANCTTDNFNVFIQHLDRSQDFWDFSGTFGGAFNQWVSVVIPLNALGGVPINDIFSPFGMTMNPGNTGTCYIDNVRYVNPPAPDAAVFNPTLKNIADQSPATRFSWTGLTLPTTWARADQYIDLELDDPNNVSWGVQIYTDNTHSPNPSTTFVSAVSAGTSGSNPAGLVDTGNTGHVLPLAWSVKAGTNTPVATAPTAAEPNDNGVASSRVDKNAFQWLYMEDLATPDIPSDQTKAFANGTPFVVVKDNLGIHFGQSDTEIGPADPPNYIYLEANFSAASTPRTFATDALTVEYFSQ